jgi:RNA polymerase sigma factor (sigma-70 family)
MSYLEETKNPFNKFQQEVAMRLFRDDRDDFFARLDFVEVIDRVLLPREKLIIQLILEGYTQEEIGQRFKISKPRVNVLLQRAKAKIKRFYLGG